MIIAIAITLYSNRLPCRYKYSPPSILKSIDLVLAIMTMNTSLNCRNTVTPRLWSVAIITLILYSYEDGKRIGFFGVVPKL